ncbi:helix-turn-helix transcriptional regulator [Mycobacterium sp. 1423905.2]|uniref:helix-turn-helix transcriptional regulator n=1 Tax=Mycobacterium sp. 1423905.2 TaxID=1856859 RepID=UPI0007FF9C32|nr:helix-turn-helix transcriptional regulator [Mycobacterium sp. 1423905.2]OBJ56648.1 AraC family transcriptional regulator [Mycobacterium sp. 1423905.2]
MQDLDFDSTDISETEEFLGRAYTKMRIDGEGEQSRARIERRWLGPVNFDQLHFTYDMSYDANPLERVVLCRVESGQIEEDFADQPQDVFAPGDLTLVSLPERPFSGRVCHARYKLTGFDPKALGRVATAAAQHRVEPVRLTGHRPVSQAAADRLNGLLDYLGNHVLADPHATSSPLLVGNAASHLAATTLHTFPNNAVVEPTGTDRRDATKPVLLRRAMAYMDDNARTDISLSDIAEHIYVTPRALQYMFRQHLDCTPMEYLRRIRLEQAHRELLDSSRADCTVKRIANRWGFAHVGRFAVYYRQTYGQSPHAALRN